MKKSILYIIVVFTFSACMSAEYKNELAHCKSLQFVEEDTCLQRLAIAYKNSAPCESIRQSGVRIPCIVEVAKTACDTSICNNISENWQRPYCETAVTSLVQCSTK